MPNIAVLAMSSSPNNITLEALRVLKSSSHVVLRVETSAWLSFLTENNIAYTTLNDVYDQSETYEQFNHHTAEYLMALQGNVCYIVPEPLLDSSVQLLNTKTTITMLEGVSLSQIYLNHLQEFDFLGWQCTTATHLSTQKLLPQHHLLVLELGNQLLASQAKLHLLNFFDAETNAVFLTLKGEDVQKISIKLFELDHQPIDEFSAVFIPAQPFLKRQRFNFEDLEDIIAVLRSPNGCPWDRKQTHQSLQRYLVEESHEVIGAIAQQNMEALCEELGDVLLQVALHANIAQEHQEFTMQDITSSICNKMIQRHVHVFGDVQCQTAEDVVKVWEEVKKKEKGTNSLKETISAIDTSLPTLLYVSKVFSKLSKAYPELNSSTEVFAKLCSCVQKLDNSNELKEKLMGEILIQLINFSRLNDVDCEVALRTAIMKLLSEYKLN